METFWEEEKREHEHIKKRPEKKTKKKVIKKKDKIEKVMKEFSEGRLHSGSKKGPRVSNKKQAIAIALSEARRKKKK